MDFLTAVSGEEALQELKRETMMDVVVQDLNIPGLHGMEVLNEIKKLNPPISMIILTGHGSVNTAVNGMKIGAFNCVTKPCDFDELTEKIERAL